MIKRRSNSVKLKVFVLGILFLVDITRISHASQLDFSWSASKTYIHNKVQVEKSDTSYGFTILGIP